ncbi:MAG TPA: PKD domain-containing protein [candidate division Zixibacteria bacterium]|nr:PKD domain-containing protein [candidate division Zixibacteria bacterium]
MLYQTAKGGLYPRIGIALLLLIAVVFQPRPAQATIIDVPDDQPTIQAGIDAAQYLDTVLVADGRYYENITFGGKWIVLASHHLIDSDPRHIFNTIIDGSQPVNPDTASVVRIVNSENSFTILHGFTITGGTGTIWADEHGFGDYREGGGILCAGTSPIIRFNNIIDNEAVLVTSGLNSAGGGAIRVGDGNPLITNNIIMYNRGRYGAGIVFNFASGTVMNCVIAHNSGGEDYAGSGIWKYQGTTSFIENNTIVYNTSAIAGGGVYCWAANMVLNNNIIWGNTAPAAAQIRITGATVTASYCAVQGGYAGTGNISDDPQLFGEYFYHSENSPCIDAGNPNGSYVDQADPSTPDSAWWPSRGTTINDIGAYGGPGAEPFERLAVFAEPTLGWVPLEVSFKSESRSSGDNWLWLFGDGDSAFSSAVSHLYEERGWYDVSVLNIDGVDTITTVATNLVAALSDSLQSDSVTVESGQEAIIRIVAVNTIPLSSMTVPVEYSGSVALVLDSFNTVGCRTNYFDYVEQTHSAESYSLATFTLTASPSGSTPDLEPGTGPILNLFFHVTGSPNIGDTTVIALDGYAGHMPLFTSDLIQYTPLLAAGHIGYTSCCVDYRGNVDNDPNQLITIADLVYLVDYMFNSGPEPICMKEANIDGDFLGQITVADLVYLVNYMFDQGPLPVICY